MKTNGNWWTAVLSAGITAGYVTTVVQLSPGPGYMFSTLRSKLAVKTENLANSLATRLKGRWRNVQQATGSCAVDSVVGEASTYP